MILDVNNLWKVFFPILIMISSCKKKELNNVKIEKIYVGYNSEKRIYMIDCLETKNYNSQSNYIGSYIVENGNVIQSSQLKLVNYTYPENKMEICYSALLFKNNYEMERKISHESEIDKKLKKYIKENLKFYLIESKMNQCEMLIDQDTSIKINQPRIEQ